MIVKALKAMLRGWRENWPFQCVMQFEYGEQEIASMLTVKYVSMEKTCRGA